MGLALPRTHLYLLFYSPHPPRPFFFSLLCTLLALHLWYSVDEGVAEDRLSSQSPSSDLEAEVQSTPGLSDQEQLQGQDLEDELSSLEQEGNTSHHQVRGLINCWINWCNFFLKNEPSY